MSRRIRKHTNPFNVRTELGKIDRMEIFGREAPLEIDLGCGGASFVYERARNHPELDFVGLEVRKPLVEAAAARREREGSRNVVVLYANHVTTDIPEDFGNGGHCGYEIQVWGSGPARVFRGGQMYDVTWVRFSQTDVIGLVGADNQIVPLAPGNTWFALVDFDSPTTAENGVFSTRFKGPSQSQGCPVG